MKDIIRMNQLAGVITESQAKKMMEILNEDSPVETKLIKKGTKFKNNFNGKILTVAKDFEVTLPIDKKSGRKFAMMYSPEYESATYPSGIKRFQIGYLFKGGFTQID
jgi:hypothetical protein